MPMLKPKGEGLKIIWHSNSPWAATGYGNQTQLFAPRLKADGHEVAISAFYGLSGSTLDWNGIRIYPGAHHPYGNDVLTAHAENWFGGLDMGLILTLIDAWVLDPVSLGRAKVACWTPVDHYPVPPRVSAFFHQSGAVPIAMSRFGESALREQGLDPLYVPHGIDTTAFAPRDRTAARKSLGWPESAYVVGMVAANKGYPSRKGFPQAIEAFARFHREHNEAMLYLHSEPTGVMAGVNIPAMLAEHKIPPEAVRFADPYFCSILGFTNDHMANAYSAMDVFLNPALGEGFGIPIMEAQACFPADTLVTAADVQETFEHCYSGDLVRIETGRGDVIEATADHPFWTDKGWIPAKELSAGEHQLLYTGGHVETEHIHAGRLENLVASLRDDAASRSGEADGTLVWVGAMAQEPGGNHQAVLADSRAMARHRDAGAVGVHGGHDRRRGHGLDPAAPWSHQAAHQDRELIGAGHGVVHDSVRRSIDLYRETAPAGVRGTHSLSVPHRGPGVSGSLQGAPAVPSHQGASDGMPHRVQRDEIVAEPRGTVDRPPVGSDRTSESPQYQAIRAVSRRAVTDHPVYNLRTASGTYMAEGYLVHNCGTPVIVTDWTAMPEVGHVGWHVAGERLWTDQQAYVKVPYVDAIYAALDRSYDMAPRMREKAREHALGYDADLVMERYWRPALGEIMRRLGLDGRPAELPVPAQIRERVAA